MKKAPKRETRSYVCTWEDTDRFMRYTAICDVVCDDDASEDEAIAHAIEAALNSRARTTAATGDHTSKTMRVIRLEAMPEFDYTTEFKVTPRDGS